MRFVSLSSLAVVCALLFNKADAANCRAAAFSGGGSRGAWEAGAVYAFNHAGNPADVAWDVVSGVSAGAINAGGISLFAPNDGKAMSEWLVNTWASLTNDQIYKNWPLGIIDALFNKGGYYDTTPLKQFLTNLMNEKGSTKRHVYVSSVDANTGKYMTFSDSNIPFKDLPTAVVASASVPFVFPPTSYNGNILIDGGTGWNINLISAVDKCKEMGFKDQEIIIDIFNCRYDGLQQQTDTSNSFSNYMRYRDIHSNYNDMNDVYEFMRSRPLIKYRYLINPSKPLVGSLGELSFDQKTIAPMIEQGKADGANAIIAGEGTHFRLLKEYMELPHEEKQNMTFETYTAKMLA